MHEARGLDDRQARVDLLGEAGKDMPVLVPNERGLDRALEKGSRHIAIFGSATETFAQKNLNRSLDDQFAMFEPTVQRALAEGMDVRAYVSMCFGDPWEGAVAIDQVVGVGRLSTRLSSRPSVSASIQCKSSTSNRSGWI